MYYVYVLENKEGRHYIGSCENIAKRLKQHNCNDVRSTKNKGPFKLIYKEEFATRVQARQREYQIKSYKGNSKFLKLINNPTPSSSLV